MERVGVWFVGALGDVATTALVGARAIARGLAATTGLVTAREPLCDLDLAGLGDLVFAGHDVREASMLAGARALASHGVVPTDLVEAVAGDLEAAGARVRPGPARGAADLVRRLEGPAARELSRLSAAGVLERVRADLRAFRAAEGLARVVVVAVASTEPRPDVAADAATAAGVAALVARDDPRLPASTLYALAAAEEGCAYVNFTPSLGATPPGVQAVFAERGVPHMGNDGKTGQTLLRTTLAPMLLERNLNVLSWAGFNILGNRDGAVLDEPGPSSAKTEGKDRVLRAILGDRLGTSLTRIDYVPSLGDWKTAWDHVHFEGFLGARMRLETTWHGCDSALAAPLVLDLVRLMDLAARRGRAGLQPGLAGFFKAPLGTDELSFPAQARMLAEYAAALR